VTTKSGKYPGVAMGNTPNFCGKQREKMLIFFLISVRDAYPAAPLYNEE
jgi:hypothetical protein